VTGERILGFCLEASTLETIGTVCRAEQLNIIISFPNKKKVRSGIQSGPLNYLHPYTSRQCDYLTRSETRAECVNEPLAPLLVPVIDN